jgi:hypothetical protein
VGRKNQQRGLAKMNGQIVEKLTPEVKIKLDKNIAADLTKIDKSEVLGHFN